MVKVAQRSCIVAIPARICSKNFRAWSLCLLAVRADLIVGIPQLARLQVAIDRALAGQQAGLTTLSPQICGAKTMIGGDPRQSLYSPLFMAGGFGWVFSVCCIGSS